MSDEIDLYTLPEVAERLDISVSRVHQLLRDGTLAATRRSGVRCVPAAFLDQTGVVKGLTGTLTVLRDVGYSEEDAIEWLFEADDSLPGTPIQALRENRGTEVRRRAQATGF